MLFFGRLQPYKGLEYLVTAFELLARKSPAYRLIIAGEPKKGSEAYESEIRRRIAAWVGQGSIVPVFKFIADADVELYFKAADVLVLPYKDIFQSGVLFLGLTFGLPVVASDVGSFSESIVPGRTGEICRPGDVPDLAAALQRYFESELYRDLSARRVVIREATLAGHSWRPVGELTRSIYVGISAR